MQVSPQLDYTQIGCPILRMPKRPQSLFVDLLHAGKRIFVSSPLSKLLSIFFSDPVSIIT